MKLPVREGCGFLGLTVEYGDPIQAGDVQFVVKRGRNGRALVVISAPKKMRVRRLMAEEQSKSDPA